MEGERVLVRSGLKLNCTRVSVMLYERPECSGGQPPIMSTSTTSFNDHQIYKTTIKSIKLPLNLLNYH